MEASTPQIKENETSILIVEDESFVLDVMVLALTRKGYLVKGVSDARSALQLLENHQYHLILCDMRMPQMSGIEFYQAVAETHQELLGRLIFMTGNTFCPGYQEFFKRTGVVVLPKPFGLPVLFSTLEHKLELLNSAGG